MREWLTAIIVLLIVAVILDGLRRMRQHRRSSLRMSLSMHQGTNKEDLQDYGSELPSGGARVVDVRAENDAKQRNKQIRQSSKDKLSRLGRPYKIPEQVTLNLDEQVPMLMESVQEAKPAKKNSAAQSSNARPLKHQSPQIDLINDIGDDGRIEPQFQEVEIDEEDLGEADFADAAPVNRRETNQNRDAYSTQQANQYEDDEIEDVLFAEKVSGRQYIEESSNATEIYDNDEVATVEDEQYLAEHDVSTEKFNQHLENEINEDSEAEDYLDAYEDEVEAFDEIEEDFEDEIDEEIEEEIEEEYREPDLVLVINVTAPKGDYFPGQDLLDTVLAQGMRFGVMNVFHHHAEANGEGSILYSMANIVVPGTFDLNAMNSFVTPGVSLFLALPVQGDSGKAFETMLGTARAIAQNLGGDLKDENRSVLTQQTVEHYRSRIKEYERKRLSRGRT